MWKYMYQQMQQLQKSSQMINLAQQSFAECQNNLRNTGYGNDFEEVFETNEGWVLVA